MILAALGSEKL